MLLRESLEGWEVFEGELAFAEKFEAAGESPQIDGLLKFEAKGGGGRFDSKRINPN